MTQFKNGDIIVLEFSCSCHMCKISFPIGLITELSIEGGTVKTMASDSIFRLYTPRARLATDRERFLYHLEGKPLMLETV